MDGGNLFYCKYCGGEYPIEKDRKGRHEEFCSPSCRKAKNRLDKNRIAREQYERRQNLLKISESVYARMLARNSYIRFEVWITDNYSSMKAEEVKKIYEQLTT